MPHAKALGQLLQSAVAALAQVVQEQSWAASSSSSIIRRCLSSRAVLVLISMPSRGSMEQEASIFPVFTSSTMHIRHAP